MQQIKITPSVTARTQTVDEYLRDLGRLEMVSPEEEMELAQLVSTGDKEAKKKLTEDIRILQTSLLKIKLLEKL